MGSYSGRVTQASSLSFRFKEIIENGCN